MWEGLMTIEHRQHGSGASAALKETSQAKSTMEAI
jgi:hypothetical protein